MQASLIVAAGGLGTRFRRAEAGRGRRTKLFFPLAGKPLLARTLAAFRHMKEIRETVLAVPPGSERQVRSILREAGLSSAKIVRGGKTRAESVWKALSKTRPHEWVLVHDGARPLVTPDLIRLVLGAADKSAAGVILGRRVVPTLKQADAAGRILGTVDRSRLFEAETPQLVRRSLLKEAYRRASRPFEATDEASLLEALGAPLRLVAHEDWNPKITHARDLELAEAYLARGQAAWRTGFGRDTHRLTAGRKLVLGGVRIPFGKGALGHSDGDALLHAAADAVLGAIGAGDIGEWFPDRDPRFKNLDSAKILRAVLAEAAGRGWRPEHLDSVILLEKPRLGPLKEKIRRRLARLLGLAEENVSVKAKTMEGLGPVGEGLAVSAEALVTLRRLA